MKQNAPPDNSTQTQSTSPNSLVFSFQIIKGMLLQVLVFELIYKVFTLLIIKPLLSFLLQTLLSVSGFQLAFNDSIAEFFLTWYGILAAIILVIISGLFIYYEYAVVTILAYSYAKGRTATMLGAMKLALGTFRVLKSPSSIIFAIYVLGLIPLANIGISSSILPKIAIPNFVSGELTKTAWGGLLLFAALAIVMLLLFCTIFIIPIMVLEDLPFGKAAMQNFAIIKNAKTKLLGTYAAFVLAWFILYQAPQAVFSSIFNTPTVSPLVIFSTFGFSWESLVLLLLSLLIFVASVLMMPMLFSIIVAGYVNVHPADAAFVSANNPALQKWARKTIDTKGIKTKMTDSKWFKILRIPVSLVLVLALGFGVFQILNRGLGLHPPIVIGHRGSNYAIENTLEAIQGAIDAKAAYAEIDILLSSDGVPMVIHDTDLQRLSGKAGLVHSMTAQELSQVVLVQGEKTSRIPTLEETIQFCQGKIKLAIELKLHGKENRNLVDSILEVVDKYDFMEQSLFLSLEYTLVEELNQKRPESYSGFCIYGTVGILDPYTVKSMMIDFIVVEETILTPALVMDFRRAWLPVYAWTVNDATSMQRYLDMGVLGIVTDDPNTGVSVVDAYNENSNVVYLPKDEQAIYATVRRSAKNKHLSLV